MPDQIEIEMQEELAKGRERLEKSIKELEEEIKRVEKMIEEDKANIELQKDNLIKAKKLKRRWRSKTYIKGFETNIRIANNNYKNHENLLRDLKQDLADAKKRLQEI
jgi:exonuclease VII small subunit